MAFVNEAVWDRITRIIVGIVVLYLGWGGVVSGTFGVILIIIGILLLLTGIVGFCPAYTVLKYQTLKVAGVQEAPEEVAPAPEPVQPAPEAAPPAPEAAPPAPF